MRRIMLVVIGLCLITITLVGCATVEIGAEGSGGRNYQSPKQN